MKFGNRNNFSIDVAVDDVPEMPNGMWGRLRLWVKEIPIGNFDEPMCGLATTHMGFSRLLKNKGILWRDEFAELSPTELWNLLDGTLYGYHMDAKVHHMKYDYNSEYSKFDIITGWGEMFDQDPRSKGFIFEHPSGVVRILTPDAARKSVETYNVNKIEFYKCVSEFCEWFRKLEDAKWENA